MSYLIYFPKLTTLQETIYYPSYRLVSKGHGTQSPTPTNRPCDSPNFQGSRDALDTIQPSASLARNIHMMYFYNFC